MSVAVDSIGLTADHLDGLQEVVNVAMGKAGAALGAVLDAFVRLSVPSIHVIENDRQLYGAASPLTQGDVWAVRQAYYDQLEGEAIVLFGGRGCSQLRDLFGAETEASEHENEELLLEVGNILVGACMNGIAAQLRANISFSPPSLHSRLAPVHEVLGSERLAMKTGLLLDIYFTLEERSFESQILILMPKESIRFLAAAVGRFMDAL